MHPRRIGVTICHFTAQFQLAGVGQLLRSADADTRLVSAADKLNNVRSILTDYREIGQSVWARFQGGRDGTLWYYRALCDQFLRRKPNRLTREFALAVRELETVEKTESNMD